MSPAKKANKAVHRQWRKAAYRLLTADPQDMSSLLTGLLTASSAAQQELKAATQQKQIADEMADIWAAARLGFSGAKALTLAEAKKPQKLILWAAFRYGQSVHNGYKERFRDPEHIKKAGARTEAPQGLREALQRRSLPSA